MHVRACTPVEFYPDSQLPERKLSTPEVLLIFSFLLACYSTLLPTLPIYLYLCSLINGRLASLQQCLFKHCSLVTGLDSRWVEAFLLA